MNAVIRRVRARLERLRLPGLRHMLALLDHRREIAAVLAGQRRYAEAGREGHANSYLLRRNVHRLEKGLSMRPLRDEFASEYVAETVEMQLKAETTEGYDPAELQWARDVLTLYFETVQSTDPAIRLAKERFTVSRAGVCTRAEAIPYRRDLAARPVEPDALARLCHRRRSVRWFSGDPVPRALLDNAFEVAAQAPSACNRQPFRFRVFDDPSRAAHIAAIPMGTKGFSQQVPGVIVVVGQLRAYPFARDRHAIYIDAALAVMSLMLALETHGVATCPINWPDQEPHESRMRRELKLDDDERVIMLVAYGWPDPEGMVPFSAKKPLAKLRSYEHNPDD